MAWDKNLPAGATAVSASDNAIRDNWAYLRDAIRQEHADPDANSSTPANIVHLQGSARAIVYTGATVLDSSADVVAAVAQLYHSSADVGRIVVDMNSTTPTGAVWYCVAADTFVEHTKLWGALNMVGALTVGGLLTASSGVTIPTTKLLTGPAGESWIVNGAQTMNPLLHAARHLFGGQDALAGLIASNIIYKSAAGPTGAAGTLNTHTYDFSGRAGNTLLLVVAWGTVFFDDVAASNTHTVEAAIQLNDVDKSQVSKTTSQVNGANHTIRSSFFAATAFTATNAAGQKVDWEAKTIAKTGGVGSPSVIDYGMLIVDLGTVGLTT